MSLQPRTSAPGKARRAASAGKPKRTKKAAEFKESAPKARHTTAQKAARKGAAAKPQTSKGLAGKPASTRRYSDVDTTATSKKETRLVERSKLRAKRYQEQTASKPRPTEEPAERSARIERSQRPDSRAKKFVKEREVRESAPRAERTERPATRPEFKKTYKRQNVQSVQLSSAKIHVPHLRRIQILVQLIVVMLLRQRLPAQMMVVQTLSHVSAKSLIQLAQRRAVLHQIHAQLTSAQSVQYAIAAMILRPMLVMTLKSMLNLIQMQRSISVQMTTTFQQILQMQTLLMQLP
jgi:hypothetical protein